MLEKLSLLSTIATNAFSIGLSEEDTELLMLSIPMVASTIESIQISREKRSRQQLQYVFSTYFY